MIKTHEIIGVPIILSEYQRLAATDARPISDVYGSIAELEWDQLVKTFLRTGS